MSLWPTPKSVRRQGLMNETRFASLPTLDRRRFGEKPMVPMSLSEVSQRFFDVSAAKTALATVPYTRCAERSSRSVRASYAQIGLYTFAKGSTT